MSAPADPLTPVAAPARLPQVEFIAMIAMLFATIAFSIDAMLPALPQMAADLDAGNANRAQLILTSFVLGMGVGTLFTGPLSDAFGRKPLVLGGAALYIVAAAVAANAQSLETMLVARLFQGLGAAGPRVVALAIVRDLYSGRAMARIMSFVMMVFTLVPAIAPTLGAGIIWFSDWRGIFAAFIVFSLIGATWMGLRQAETLPLAARRPFRARQLALGVREVITHPVSGWAIAVQCFCFAPLFVTLSTTQQVFDVTFDRGDSFPYWYALVAVLAGSASVLNAALVVRLGMRFLVRTMLLTQLGLTSAYCLALVALPLGPTTAFVLYMIWITGLFFQAGMTIGNLNALAMEPMGHLAGLAASVTGAVATIVSVLLAAPIGQLFDGSVLPLAVGVLGLVAVALGLMRQLNQTP